MSETETRTPLRKPTTVEIVGVYDNSTVYRRLFKSLGLGTPAALFSFFQTTQGNMRRAYYRNNPKTEVPPVEAGEPPDRYAPMDDFHAGFEIEMMEEDPEGDINPSMLGIGKLIVGDESIAAYDDGYNVLVAVREDSVIVVYNIRDLILIALDELRLQFSRAVAPPAGKEVTIGVAKSGCISALAALLGLGYYITPGVADGEVMITVQNRIGTAVSLTVQHMSGLIQAMLESDPARAADPEWIFLQIDSASKHTANSRKQVEA